MKVSKIVTLISAPSSILAYPASCPPISPGDFTVQQKNLYPESAAWDPQTCRLFMSSAYNLTLVEYDPYSRSSTVLSIPGLSNAGTFNFTEYHLNGVDYDYSTGLVYIAAGAATAFTSTDTGDYSHQNLTGPNLILRFDPRSNEFLAQIDLAAAQKAYFRETGNRTTGFQDVAETTSGDVYAIGTFGNSIVKIANDAETATLWYAPQVYNNMYGFGGIFAHGDKLVISDSLSGGLVTFDTACTGEPEPTYVPLEHDPDSYEPLMADGLFAPSKYGGQVALWSNDYNGTLVYASNDDWKSAKYLGLVPNDVAAADAGGLAVATFEMGDRIYSVNEYFQFELPVKEKDEFPVYDITDQVDQLVEGRS